MVYVVLNEGLAVTDDDVVLFNPVEGLQRYDVAPEAIKDVDELGQMDVFEDEIRLN